MKTVDNSRGQNFSRVGDYGVDKLQIIPIVYAILIDIYLVLIAIQLSGVNESSVVARTYVLAPIMVISIISICMSLLRGRSTYLFLGVLAYISYLLIVSRFSSLGVEELFYVCFGPFIFLASTCVFRKVNASTFNFICNIKFAVLLFYFVMFFIVFKVFGRQNGVVINTLYYQLALLPFLMMNKSKLLFSIAIFLVLISAAMAGKRLPLILGFGCFLYVIFLKTRIESLGKLTAKRLWSTAFGIAFLFTFIVIFFTSDFVSIDRILALLEDGGSGRVTLTLRFFEELNSITPLGLLIGHGVHLSSSTLLGDHSVHNDILEVFYRIGAIGLFLYILMLVLVFRLGCKVSRVQKVHGSVLKASVFIFLIISLASMLIFIPSYVLQFFIFWTLLISLNLSNNKEPSSVKHNYV